VPVPGSASAPANPKEPFMKLHLAAAAVALVLLPAAALADDENASCTDAAKDTWLSVDAVKAKAEAAGYNKIKKVKVEGTCYEIYAFDKDGKKVEVLFDPATGEKAGTEGGPSGSGIRWSACSTGPWSRPLCSTSSS
jgi:hypothetical protein